MKWTPRIWPVLTQPTQNQTGSQKKETGLRARNGFIPTMEEAVNATPASFGSGQLCLEVDGVLLAPPNAPPTPPNLTQPGVVIADHVESPPVIVVGPPGWGHRKIVLSAEISLVELILFCERAKARGEARVELIVVGDTK